MPPFRSRYISDQREGRTRPSGGQVSLVPDSMPLEYPLAGSSHDASQSSRVLSLTAARGPLQDAPHQNANISELGGSQESSQGWLADDEAEQSQGGSHPGSQPESQESQGSSELFLSPSQSQGPSQPKSESQGSQGSSEWFSALQSQPGSHPESQESQGSSEWFLSPPQSQTGSQDSSGAKSQRSSQGHGWAIPPLQSQPSLLLPNVNERPLASPRSRRDRVMAHHVERCCDPSRDIQGVGYLGNPAEHPWQNPGAEDSDMAQVSSADSSGDSSSRSGALRYRVRSRPQTHRYMPYSPPRLRTVALPDSSDESAGLRDGSSMGPSNGLRQSTGHNIDGGTRTGSSLYDISAASTSAVVQGAVSDRPSLPSARDAQAFANGSGAMTSTHPVVPGQVETWGRPWSSLAPPPEDLDEGDRMDEDDDANE